MSNLTQPIKASKPNITRLLEISTAHVPFESSENCEDWAYGEFDQGMWSYVPSESGEDYYKPKGDLPEWLKPIHNYARKHGCSWILFDADCCIEDELPSFSHTWP
jgi:hypothetical protein